MRRKKTWIGSWGFRRSAANLGSMRTIRTNSRAEYARWGSARPKVFSQFDATNRYLVERDDGLTVSGYFSMLRVKIT
jgi:hypothetical protein